MILRQKSYHTSLKYDGDLSEGFEQIDLTNEVFAILETLIRMKGSMF